MRTRPPEDEMICQDDWWFEIPDRNSRVHILHTPNMVGEISIKPTVELTFYIVDFEEKPDAIKFSFSLSLSLSPSPAG